MGLIPVKEYPGCAMAILAMPGHGQDAHMR